ncbi:MAG: hypothetical protein ACKVP7_18655 [Hyphomicrobiaceae bacterium]
MKIVMRSAIAAGLLLASMTAVQAQSSLLPRLDPQSIERSTEAPQQIWSKGGRSNVCVTRTRRCTFSDGKSRPIGTPCVCTSQPGVKGRAGG